MRKRNDEYWMNGKIGRKKKGKEGRKEGKELRNCEEGREIWREEGKERKRNYRKKETEGRKGRR
jgi:hypothetical protein